MEPPKIQQIDLNTDTLQGARKVYHKSYELSVERTIHLRKLTVRAALATDFIPLMQGLQGLKSYIEHFIMRDEGYTLADFYAKVDNLTYGVRDIDKMLPVEMQVAALFFNAPDEDLTKFTPEMVAEKVKDWNDGGVPGNFFEGFFQELIKLLNANSE